MSQFSIHHLLLATEQPLTRKLDASVLSTVGTSSLKHVRVGVCVIYSFTCSNSLFVFWSPYPYTSLFTATTASCGM